MKTSKEKLPASFKDALRLLRMCGGLKGKELAHLLGISQSYLSEIETGRKEPSLMILGKYEEIFGVPISKIALLEERLRGTNANPIQKLHILAEVVLHANQGETNGRFGDAICQ